ncbi:MAG: transcription antitermination factor NusB [Gammaproteobacteria bacterium]|nr:transcription antitermination factor NusB [Gammaproteobacteria bacterium]MXX17599.1 transcription antitermination factor NusB [Gammaproteobacteria bacterium]
MARSGRHLARRCVIQALYQWQITGQAPDQIMRTFIDNDNLTGKHRDFFQVLMDAIPMHIDQIDTLIEPHLDRGGDRVDPVEQAILRLGTYELRFDQSVPTSVVIDEAIDLAKTFGSEHGYRYVNGVLDKVAKAVRE